MRFAGAAVLLWLFCALALAGCGGKIPPTHHYTLEPAMAAPPAAATSYPLNLTVMRFTAARALEQDRLVFRPAPHKVEFYEYHRWADAPPDMVTKHVVSQLRSSGLFRSVSTTLAGGNADYILRGNIDSLEEVDASDAVSARVALSVELVDARTRQVVWTGRGSHETSVGERSVDGIVRALNDSLKQSIEQLTRGLATWLQQRPPA